MAIGMPFDEVYGQHHDKIYRFCLSQVGNPTVAEDICADVFTNAFAAYERARPDADGVVPWLFRIARNGIIDEGRRRARWTALLMSALVRPSVEVAPDDVAAVRDDVRTVIAAMSELRPRERELVGLRVAGQMSYDEIGSIMGMSARAAEIATRRARERLASILKTDFHLGPAAMGLEP